MKKIDELSEKLISILNNLDVDILQKSDSLTVANVLIEIGWLFEIVNRINFKESNMTYFDDDLELINCIIKALEKTIENNEFNKKEIQEL